MKTYFRKEKGPFPACCCSFLQLLRVGTDKTPGPGLILGAHTLAKRTPSWRRMPRTFGKGAFSWISACCSPLQLPQAVPDSCRQQESQNTCGILILGHPGFVTLLLLQKIRMPQAQPQAGMKELKPPSLLCWDQCLPSQTLSISSYPKPIQQRKSSPKPCSLLILVIRSPAKPIDFYFAVNQAWNPCGFGCNYTDQVINRESHLPEPKIWEWEPRSRLRAGKVGQSTELGLPQGAEAERSWVIADPRAFCVFLTLPKQPSHCWLHEAPALTIL